MKEPINYLVEICNTQFEYETNHRDAADSYEYCLQDTMINNGTDIGTANELIFWENIRFHLPCHTDDAIVSICLGQEEMEIQLPRPLESEHEVQIMSDNFYTGKVGSDLVYTMYPDNLCVGLFSDAMVTKHHL